MRTILPSVAKVLAAALPLTLCGCSFSPLIESHALSYNDVVENAADKLLVINILRSRDRAPLHFGTIPNIHESFTETGGVSLAQPIEEIGKSTTRTRAGLTPTLSLSNVPSYEIDTLDTQDFITGIASPIDAKYAKYWLDRGLDPRIVLLLFFSSAELTENVGGGNEEAMTIENDPRSMLDNTTFPCRNPDHPEFDLYLLLINKLAADNFFANGYTERTVVLNDLALTPTGKAPASVRDTADLLKDVTGIDSSKYKLTPDTEDPGRYTLYQASTEQHIAFCYKHSQEVTISGLATGGSDSCTQSTISQGASSQSKTPTAQNILQSSDPRYCEMFYDFMDSDFLTREAQAPSDFAEQNLNWVWSELASDESALYDRNKPVSGSSLTKILTGLKNAKAKIADGWQLVETARRQLSQSQPGPALAASITPQQFGALMRDAAAIDAALAAISEQLTSAPDLDAAIATLEREAARAPKSAPMAARLQEAANHLSHMIDQGQQAQNILIANLRGKLYQFSIEADVISFSPTLARQDGAALKTLTDFRTHVRSSVANVVSLQPRLSLAMRSVGGMISFLGDLTYYQEHYQQHAQTGPRHNIPLTLGFCAADSSGNLIDPHCDNGGALFYIDNPHPADPRFVVDYRGRDYPVDADSRQDHSLQVLSILDQLLNLNKSAKDLITTPYVQVLP